MLKCFMVLLIFCSTNVYGQEFSQKTITINGWTFLPYLKGKVINRISQTDIHARKVFDIIQLQPVINRPQGYEVEAYSDADRPILKINLMPYVLEDEEVIRMSGSHIIFYFNDITFLFEQPLHSGIDNIYTAPMQVGEFMGYPVYRHEARETAIICKSNEPFFLPVSQEEYLTALIKAEEEKRKNDAIQVSTDEIPRKMEESYRELLKIDKEAAKEFKKEMENYKKDLSSTNSMGDILTSLKKELALLSAIERKKQAYYALYSMEKHGKFSGLVPDEEIEYAVPLVKPNEILISKMSGDIRVIIINWELNTEIDGNRIAIRLYRPQRNLGYGFTDDKIYEIFENKVTWKSIIELIK